jgi:hypothetical protein
MKALLGAFFSLCIFSNPMKDVKVWRKGYPFIAALAEKQYVWNCAFMIDPLGGTTFVWTAEAKSGFLILEGKNAYEKTTSNETN